MAYRKYALLLLLIGCGSSAVAPDGGLAIDAGVPPQDAPADAALPDAGPDGVAVDVLVADVTVADTVTAEASDDGATAGALDGAALEAASAEVAPPDTSARPEFGYLAFDKHDVDFGILGQGCRSKPPVVLRATMTGPATGATLSARITEPFAIVEDHCTGHSLGLGESCTVSVEFRSSTLGDVSGELRVTAGPDEAIARLSGSGVSDGGGWLFADHASIQFPNTALVSAVARATVAIHNVGTEGVIVTAPTFIGQSPDAFAVGTDGCTGKTLSRTDSCQIEVLFSPKTVGAKYATMVVGGKPLPDGACSGALSATVSLSGQAVMVP